MIRTCESAPSTGRKPLSIVYNSLSRRAFNRLSQVRPTWKENKLFKKRYISYGNKTPIKSITINQMQPWKINLLPLHKFAYSRIKTYFIESTCEAQLK